MSTDPRVARPLPEPWRSIYSRVIKLGADILAQRYWGDQPTVPQAVKQDEALADIAMEARKIADSLSQALGDERQPTNAEDAAAGNVNAIKHIAYAEGYRDGKAALGDGRPVATMYVGGTPQFGSAAIVEALPCADEMPYGHYSLYARTPSEAEREDSECRECAVQPCDECPDRSRSLDAVAPLAADNSAASASCSLPAVGSQEGEALIDSALSSRDYPANPREAARAAWEAARSLSAPVYDRAHRFGEILCELIEGEATGPFTDAIAPELLARWQAATDEQIGTYKEKGIV